MTEEQIKQEEFNKLIGAQILALIAAIEKYNPEITNEYEELMKIAQTKIS